MTVAIICIVVFIILLNISEHRKRRELKQTPVVSSPTPVDILESKYVDHCHELVSKLLDFQSELENNPETLRFIMRVNGLECVDNCPCLVPHNPRTTFCILSDLGNCYSRLGGRFAITSRKQFLPPMLYFMRVAIDADPMPVSLLNGLSLEDYNPYASNFKDLISIESEITDDCDFFLDKILKAYDPTLRWRYLDLLYRFSDFVLKESIAPNHQGKVWLTIFSQFCSNNKPQVFPSSSSCNETPTTDRHTIPTAAEGTPAIDRLEKLVGLTDVKAEVAKLRSTILINSERKKAGLKVSATTYHCLFTGNPGTGKTTVARIIADIYRECGILKKGHLVETDRSGLVAEYVGQTAVKTNRIVDSALDGVLFIDEAYTLRGSDNDFGAEAVATLLKRMEDDRERLIVILAGYTDEINDFIASNPGLKSRFSRNIEFPDYSAQELMEILLAYARANDYTLTPEAETSVKLQIDKAVTNRDKHFGNARFVRNLFEKITENQATRLVGQSGLERNDLLLITIDDISERI